MTAYLILIVIFVGIIAYSMRPRTVQENFFVKDNETIANLYDTGLSTPSHTGREARYVDANNQQLMYKELVQMFKGLSGQQERTLTRKQSTMYKPETMEDDVRDELNQITNILLDYVRKTSGDKFSFSITNYDNAWIYEDERGNRQYDYDVFVQDPYNNFSIRLKINMIKYVSNGGIRTRRKADSHLNEVRDDFDYYALGPGNPSKSPKVIASPMDVIVSGLDVLNSHITNLPNLPPINAVYLNGVQIYNSNAIVNPDQFCPLTVEGIGTNPVNIGEVNDGTGPLDYGELDVKAPEPVEPWQKRNPWIRPPGDTHPREERCETDAHNWGTWGIMTVPGVSCEGVADPVKKRPHTAEFNPTIHVLSRWAGAHSWHHELDRKNPWNLTR